MSPLHLQMEFTFLQKQWTFKDENIDTHNCGTHFKCSYCQTKFYKWTDENGSIHYTSEKPENSKTDEIKINTNQPVVPQKINEAVPKDPNEKSYLEKHEEKKQNSKNIAKENKSRCLNAKHTIIKYQQQVRMSRIDKVTGEKIYLDDSKRASIIKQAQQAVRKYCN